MKIYIIATLVLFYGQEAFSILPCGIPCHDFLPTMMCKISLIQNKCIENMGVLCMQTCGKCPSCEGIRTLSLTGVDPQPTCEPGPCVDTKPLSCSIYLRSVQDGCKFVGNECKASCNLCKTCALPPTEKPCTNECEDSDKTSCAFWKKEGFCDIKKGFPHTRIACPLSCGTCKLCTTKPVPTTTAKLTTTKASTTAKLTTTKASTTAKATTTTTTSKDLGPVECSKCEDENQYCSQWSVDGYCDENKGFPDTRKACKKSCGVCTPCSHAV